MPLHTYNTQAHRPSFVISSFAAVCRECVCVCYLRSRLQFILTPSSKINNRHHPARDCIKYWFRWRVTEREGEGERGRAEKRAEKIERGARMHGTTSMAACWSARRIYVTRTRRICSRTCSNIHSETHRHTDTQTQTRTQCVVEWSSPFHLAAPSSYVALPQSRTAAMAMALRWLAVSSLLQNQQLSSASTNSSAVSPKKKG